METLTLELPAMFGDHHVIEVRRILLELSGIENVYASSSFHLVEVSYDPDKVSSEDITAKLEAAGYYGEMPIPIESGAPSYQQEGSTYFRHTEVYENTRQVISFAQKVDAASRPLWPCPGVGAIKKMEEV
jgi:copper chaperone CopZ